MNQPSFHDITKNNQWFSNLYMELQITTSESVILHEITNNNKGIGHFLMKLHKTNETASFPWNYK